jgi:DNA-binding NtrC family response regulator
MKPCLVLLYTHDRNCDRLLSETLSGTGAIVLIARSVGDAVQVVSSRGRELEFAILDFNDGCRGMTLLSAVHTCHQQLPILVTTSENAEHATAVARAYLNKPIPPARIADAISELSRPHQQLVAA